jgi:hypothetical protein
VVGTPVIAANVSISSTHVTVGLPTPVTVDVTEEFAIYQLDRGDGVWRSIAGATTSNVPAIQVPLSLFPEQTTTYPIRIRGTAIDINDGA